MLAENRTSLLLLAVIKAIKSITCRRSAKWNLNEIIAYILLIIPLGVLFIYYFQ
ncbi:hypothetical protein KIS1582_3765 [Cytobacillus firmus]|uniref:Uncharacterized protein n=1 Tax=Cytobacillus firmus TaxID=1399 RepID=A0A800N9E3_CYTFI|nr:hypothetical protein KIS1582_3765 [Cytobacillus firmus]